MAPPLSSAPVISLPIKTAGLVLAGGQSQRMGQNKALLRLENETGHTLLQHMQQLLMQAGCAPVLISGAAVGGLPDRLTDAGPLAGIEAALMALSVQEDLGQLLIVPVDMPALSVSTLQTLIAAGNGLQAIHFSQAPLPLLLPHSAATRAALQALLASSALSLTASRSVRALALAVGVNILELPDNQSQMLHNLNTPDEWRQWQQQSQQQSLSAHTKQGSS